VVPKISRTDLPAMDLCSAASSHLGAYLSSFINGQTDSSEVELSKAEQGFAAVFNLTGPPPSGVNE
jgi:hypothetical protein